MAKEEVLETVLKVAEAQQDDVDQGIVRVDNEILKKLKISGNSVLEIEGERKTIAIPGRAFPADYGLSIIRMDALTRRNAGTSIGEQVKVRAVEAKPAKFIQLAPAQKNIMLQAPPQMILRSLLKRAVTKGDVISLGGTRRRRTMLSNDPFEAAFSMLSAEFGSELGFSMGFSGLKLVVTDTNPKGPVYVTEDTEVELSPHAVEIRKEAAIPEVSYEDIGGLDEEVKKVREMIEIPMKHPEVFERLGVHPPKGVLLFGPPGTGKTLLAKAVASESKANFISINGPEIMSKFVGDAEKRVRDLFEQAEKSAPSILFIDELDAIAPKREESYGEVERRVVAQLLALMDGMKSRGKVIVIAATNRPEALDPALRRGGRFDREIEIGVPNKEGRLQILQIHTRNMPLEKDVDLKELAEITYGFVGADLEGLCKESAMNVLRRVLAEHTLVEDEKIPQEVLEKLRVTKNDFKAGLKLVRPSAMREVLVETPKVKWEEVGGLDKAKQQLKEAVEWPLSQPQVFKRMGIRPPRGVLLYGPPGCGKTLLAKAVATESKANFILVKGPEVLSKWVGESEKAIRQIFKKARQVSPAIILFDEIDSIAAQRGGEDGGARVGERVVNQILTEMDGLEELTDVVVIAATNRPELVDPALLRPGRFDRHILIPPPDKKSREEIVKLQIKDMPVKDVSVEDLAEKTNGYSGADIEAICREAAMLALRENINSKEVRKEHFDKVLKEIKPTLTKDEIDKYRKAIEHVKSGRANVPDYLG